MVEKAKRQAELLRKTADQLDKESMAYFPSENFHTVADLLEELARQLESAQLKWIGVEERLPEDDLPENSDVKVLKVFVTIKRKNGTTVRTQTRHRRTLFDTRGEPFFDWEWRYSSGKVTHWMPLPEPPKEME